MLNDAESKEDLNTITNQKLKFFLQKICHQILIIKILRLEKFFLSRNINFKRTKFKRFFREYNELEVVENIILKKQKKIIDVKSR